MTLPGRAVGAGFALTVGENELLPPTFFSVGEGALEALLSEDSMVLAGFSLVVLLHAVSAPMLRMAAAPAAKGGKKR